MELGWINIIEDDQKDKHYRRRPKKEARRYKWPAVQQADWRELAKLADFVVTAISRRSTAPLGCCGDGLG